jgi:ABC-type glutathione transport system ATPase component
MPALRRVAEFSTLRRYREDTSNDIISWLRSGRDVLHIPGNSGSGKSTLMKFIAGHERTKTELEAWAADKQLIFGQFYAWSAGEKSQRSMSGLYRSVLFQTLSQCPELMEMLFPHQLSRMKVSQTQGDVLVEKAQDFEMTAFKRHSNGSYKNRRHFTEYASSLTDSTDSTNSKETGFLMKTWQRD